MSVEQGFKGIKTDLTLDQHHQITLALGASQIKAALKSMAHFKTAALERREEVKDSRQAAFDLGTVVHGMVLEQSMDACLKGPQCSTKAVKEWKEFVAAHPNKIVLTPGEFERVHEMFNAFTEHPTAEKIVSRSKVEHSFFDIDQETGLWLKARPDGYWFDDDGTSCLFDFKTTGQSCATPREFAGAVARYQYHISAAHYIAVVESVTGRKIQDYYFIVQETSAPYAVNVFKASPQMLARGEKQRRKLLNQISVAMKTGEFPGYGNEIKEIDLPAWSIDDSDINWEVA